MPKTPAEISILLDKRDQEHLEKCVDLMCEVIDNGFEKATKRSGKELSFQRVLEPETSINSKIVRIGAVEHPPAEVVLAEVQKRYEAAGWKVRIELENPNPKFKRYMIYLTAKVS